MMFGSFEDDKCDFWNNYVFKATNICWKSANFHNKKCNARVSYFDKVENIRHLVTNYFTLKVEICCLHLTWNYVEELPLSALCKTFSSPRK